MIVSNFFGGPGVGKSTLAAIVYSMLKRRGINCEYSHEWIKWRLVWEGDSDIVDDQLFIFANQHRQQFVLRDKVDVCITDSPLMMSLAYGKMFEAKSTKDSNPFFDLVRDRANSFDNLNFWVHRSHPYDHAGRPQTETQANIVNTQIQMELENEGVPLNYIDSNIDPYDVVERIIRELEQRG